MTAPLRVLTGDHVRDELLLAMLDAERRVDSYTRALLRCLEFGLGLAGLRRQRRELREALADLAVLRHLMRALDAAEGEVAR